LKRKKPRWSSSVVLIWTRGDAKIMKFVLHLFVKELNAFKSSPHSLVIVSKLHQSRVGKITPSPNRFVLRERSKWANTEEQT